MQHIIADSLATFGMNHVALYSNHSCQPSHLIALLEHHVFIEENMLNEENILLSSHFGLDKYGIGLRKPSAIAFNELSKLMDLSSKKIAFVGDNQKDVDFAINAGGIGIRLLGN